MKIIMKTSQANAKNINNSKKIEPIKESGTKWKKVYENVLVWYAALGALGAFYMLYKCFDRYGVYAFIILSIFFLIFLFISVPHLNDEQIITAKIISSFERILEKNNINEQTAPEIKEIKKLINEYEKI